MKEKYFTFDKLNEYNDIIHLSTNKCMNFATPIVGEEGIKKGFEEIENDIGFKFRKIKAPHQTHSNNVRVLTEKNLEEEFDDTDGLVTNLKNVAICIRTADCQSILLYDPVKKVIGNIHSGWKGTLNKIVVNAIHLMRSKYGSKLKDILAFICPSIMKCCFEVDKDVVDSFIEEFGNIDEFISLGDMKEGKQKYFIDTVELNKKVMTDLGLKKENIISSDICTKCHSNYHSYRADGKLSGRNLSLICIKE